MALLQSPFKWTYVTGTIFLGSGLWAAALHDGGSLGLMVLSYLCLIISVVACCVLLLLRRSKESLNRLLINIFIFVLIYPVIQLGNLFRDRLFLSHLPRFQEAADLLIKTDSPTDKTEVSTTLPVGYSDLHVSDIVLLTRGVSNVTVRFVNRDASALGHGGYMYRTDDSLAALEKEFPKTVYTRLAPHWFFYSGP